MSENFIINANDNFKSAQYLIKELIKNKEELVVQCTPQGAPLTSRVCESLLNRKYVYYSDIKTETVVIGDRRRTMLLITLKKHSDFQKMYDENVQKKKDYEEQRTKK